MKLNNKAFASSTILYGILTITLLLLMLILATMKSTKDLNTKLVDSLEYKLNACITEEVELDKCRLEKESSECTPFQEVYNSCLEDASYDLK